MDNKCVAHSYELIIIIIISNNNNNLILLNYILAVQTMSVQFSSVCMLFSFQFIYHTIPFHFNAGNSNRHECDGFVRLVGEFVHAKYANVLN